MSDEIITVFCCVFPDGTTYWCDDFAAAMQAVEAWETDDSAQSLPQGCLGGFVEVRMPRSKYVALGTTNTNPITAAMHDWCAPLAPEHPSRGAKRP